MREQVVLACVALSTGVALVIALEAKISLGATLACLGAMAGAVFRLRWLKSDEVRRAEIRKRTVTGLLAGGLATLGYDFSRLLIVSLARMEFRPFHAFPLFGYLIIGERAPLWAAWIIGTAYHYLNGFAFAIAYAYLLGDRGWKWGIAWGLGLEAAMFTVYPGWLDLQAVMAEFAVVSLTGHIVYGTTLGVVCEIRSLGG
jgi:hypothetical protein